MTIIEICAISTAVITALAFVWNVFYESKKLVMMSSKNSKKAKASKNIKLHASPFFTLFGRSFFKKYSMHHTFKAAKKISNLLEKDHFHPTLIIGIGRGGAIFGSIVSYNYHHTPIISIDRNYTWTERRKDEVLFDFTLPLELTKEVLLIAGEAHTGNTMTTFIDFVHKSNPNANIKTAVFYKQTICTSDIDYCGYIGPDAPLMPWQDTGYIRDSLSKEESLKLKKQ